MGGGRAIARAAQALEWCYRAGQIEAGLDEAGRGCLAGPVFAAAVVWPSAAARPDVAADPRLRLVRDSKTLSPAQRERAREFVEHAAVAFAVGSASAQEIDRINILHASHRAMHRALDLLHEPLPLPLPPPPPEQPQQPEPGDGRRTPRPPRPPEPRLAARGGEALGARGVEFLVVDGDRFDAYIAPGPDGERRGFVPHACFPGGDGRFLAVAAASVLAKTYRDAYVRTTLHPRHPQYGWDESKGYGTAKHMAALELHGACDEHRRSFAPVAARMDRQDVM
jgi:ribonuclease HII